LALVGVEKHQSIMNKLRVLFFFGLLAVVILIARHNSRRLAPAEKTTVTSARQNLTTATPTATQTPAQVAQQTPSPPPVATPPNADFGKVAGRVAPAVALISAFDASGKVLHSGSGWFVSADGRLITTADMVQGTAHAVAKVSDGRILNIIGILAAVPSLDVAVLKTETKKGVPCIVPNKSTRVEDGGPVAVVGSMLVRRQPVYFERTVAARGADAGGEWLGLSAATPGDCIGAPVINDRGEAIGIVTSQRPQGAVSNVVRNGAAIDSLLTRTNPRATATWQVVDNGGTLGPGEAPTATPIKIAKISSVQSDQPGTSTLIYSPRPKYPVDARHSNAALQGEGRYRIHFSANGLVQDVAIVQSTHNAALDTAATQTLQKWKAAPGREWTATVPITFQP
jgi:TonB family protein